MHRECALNMVRYRGSICGVCGERINTGWLLQQQTHRPEENALIEHQNNLAERKRNGLLHTYTKTWWEAIWPTIVEALHPQVPGDAFMALVCLMEPEIKSAFCQRMMDAGKTRATALATLEELAWICDNYDGLPGVLKGRMKRSLSRYVGGGRLRRRRSG